MTLDREFLINAAVLVLAVGFLLLFSGCSEVKEERKTSNADKIIEAAVQNRIVYTSSIADINTLFSDINYTMKHWNEGVREIPRVYITDISSRWQSQSQKIEVKTKKAIFFQLTIPLVLHANELLIVERKKFDTLGKRVQRLNHDEEVWLSKLALKYKVMKKDDNVTLDQKLDLLNERVDVIPPSLALAQAAEESGWGASRFAILGNSLFGQWAFSKDAMRPKQQRKELGDYGLARFNTPQDAVNAYMLNLNTHRAYRKMRQRRSLLRSESKNVSGHELAKTLDKYSERGQAYVDSLHAMMRINHLGEADKAYLWNKEIIYLTPLKDKKQVTE